MYIKNGAILNGKTVTVDAEGWNTINLLDYIYYDIVISNTNFIVCFDVFVTGSLNV